MKNKKVPFTATSVKTTLPNLTGHWRVQKPIYKKQLSPCEDSCLAGNDIPRWLSLLKDGKVKEAWETLVKQNPLPAVTAKVCPHPCETSCNRGQFDQALSINALERFLGEEGLRNDWRPRKTTSILEIPNVAVIGSGPAGLSCAYQLAQRGYPVTIYEAEKVLGGMLSLGIPEYRLPREMLSQEIAGNIMVAFLGIELKLNTRVGKDIDLKKLQIDYRAVFVATGAHKSRRLNIPGEDLEDVISGLTFLKKINLGEPVEIGKKVVVIGGGNTAVDAARSAKLRGADVYLFYRRTLQDMPASKEEIEAAEKEEIHFSFLVKPTKIVALPSGEKRVEFLKGRVQGKDTDGRNKVIFPEEGLGAEILADIVVCAVGEESDLSFLPKPLPENVFVGGDALDMAGTVASAIKSGREVASEIHRHFTGRGFEERTEELKTVPFEDLNLAYFENLPRQTQISDNREAAKEAERCFGCGTCNMCGNCQVFCPDLAVTKKGDHYEINYDYCKGCGICVEECPGKSIILEMEVEQ